jgi:Spy/CpxP family protein refolding chaperone
MNLKPNQTMLVTLSLLAGMALPALAQATSGNENGGTTSVAVGKKASCAANGKKLSMAREQQGHRFGHRFHRGLPLGALKGDYALTEAQSEKIVALKDQFREQAKPKFTDMMSASHKMRELMAQNNVDKSAVESLQNQINQDRDSLSNLKLETRLNELSVLTDQQREQLHKIFLRHAVRST